MAGLVGEWDAVLAGSYVGRRFDGAGNEVFLSHFLVEGAEKTLCGRLEAWKLTGGAGEGGCVRCKVCASRLAKAKAGA